MNEKNICRLQYFSTLIMCLRTIEQRIIPQFFKWQPGSESESHYWVVSALCWLWRRVSGREAASLAWLHIECACWLIIDPIFIVRHDSVLSACWSSPHMFIWSSIFVSICSSVCCMHQAALTKWSAASLIAHLPFHYFFHLIVYLKRDSAHRWTFKTNNALKRKHAGF